MSKKVNKLSETHLKVISLFTRGYKVEYYIREVEKLLKISSRTALLTLNDLEKRQILESTTRGKIRLFKIQPSLITKEYFSLCEVYKRIHFFEKNQLVREIMEKLIPHVEGITVIFGSYAKGLQKEDSDLDILVVGTHDKKRIREIEKTYGISINIKQYPTNIFKKELHKDTLLKEVVANHIVISGIDDFIKDVIQWTE
jgi:uncharacterized protein